MDGTKDIHRALAHGWMDFGPDIYGECRDIEQERSGCEMSAWVIAEQSHAWTAWVIAEQSHAWTGWLKTYT